MSNYRLTIAYDGSRYYGWAAQKNIEPTIQGKIEAVLLEMCGSPVKLDASGRTDAGVHAKGQVASCHFDTDQSPDEIRDYLNHYLPDDICITEVKAAADKFHARLNASGKTYQYVCYTGKLKPVFDKKYVYVTGEKPDIALMRKAASHLLGRHDFRSFCGNPKMKKSTVRVIDSIDIHEENDYLYITYHGNGFLQYMVRILTGTLLEVGFKKRDPDSIPALLEAMDRSKAGYTVPPNGLTLLEVDYN